MRAAIYNPYWDTLGGGERYSLAVAQVLAKEGYLVDLQWKDARIKDQLEKRFGLDLKEINVVDDVKRGDGYDLCFWVSDGSIPTLKSRVNLLHFQVPFHGVEGKTLINRMKMFRIKKVICNSNFTKQIVDKEYGVDSLVLYPPVAVEQITPKRKENIILSVGRFSQLKQAKRQDVLVKAFKKLYDTYLQGLKGEDNWKLVLAGGSEIGGKALVEKLKALAEGYPVKIIENPSFREITALYGKARIFWSASGYGIDETSHPERVEHFGITVVEAMAAGAVPIVYSAGGHKESVSEGKNGYLWKTTGGLLKKSYQLIKDKKLLREVSRDAESDSRKYSYEKFTDALTHKIL